MFYIIVVDGETETEKVVTDHRGVPREFSKKKKVHNFIDSRQYVRDRDPFIVTGFPDDIEGFKVDI
jgi:hypothetical protein